MTASIVLYAQGLPFTGDTLDKQALGGSETAVIYVARALAAMGHQVTTFCNCPEPGVFHGVTYRDASSFSDWCAADQCDLFICSRHHRIFAETIPARTKLFWSHDQYGPDQFAELATFMPYIDGVYCLSDFHWNLFADGLPQWIERLYKTHNGLDFTFLEKVTHGIQKQHQIIFTSRPERGLWSALDLYETLADRSLSFVICTYPFQWNHHQIDGYLNACDERIERLRGEGYPIETGFFSKGDLYRRLAASKVNPYPASIPEIAPITALEAQACHTIYLSPDHSGFKELVPYERPEVGTERWLELMRKALYDDAFREAWAAQGRNHIERFTWQNVAATFCTHL